MGRTHWRRTALSRRPQPRRRLRRLARSTVGFALITSSLYLTAGAYDLPTIGDPGASGVRRTLIMASRDVPPPEPAPAPAGRAPRSIPGLYQTLWDLGIEGTLGVGALKSVYVQTVRADVDRRIRLIVYLPGTHVRFDEPQGIDQIAMSLRGELKPEQVGAIESAIADCRRLSWCRNVGEVALVGYSQGGMDAQALTAELPQEDSRYGWDPALVTTVLDFATPLLSVESDGIDAVHVHERWDGVINAVNALPVPSRYTRVAEARGRRFVASSGRITDPSAFFSRNLLTMLNKLINPLAGIHSDYLSYLILAHRLQDGDDPAYDGLKRALTRFQGDVVAQTNWQYQDLALADRKARDAYRDYVRSRIAG